MPRNRATTQQTIDALLESERDALPLAKLFVQHRDSKGRALPGPLSWFVAAHHLRALLQYLLFHAVAAVHPFNAARDSRIWARALGFSESKSARAAVSRNWQWLEHHRLIKRGRAGRLSNVTLLYDDGSGRSYKHPHDRGDRYLQLPYEFWHEGWDRKLDLASIAVLLVGLNEPPGEFRLVQDRVPDWYGISTSTFHKGVQGLVRADLLHRHHEDEPRPLAPDGYVKVNVYKLRGPFEQHEGQDE